MYKPFTGLAHIIAERIAKEQAIIDAKQRARIAKAKATKERNKKFRDENITHFLEKFEITYSTKRDCIRMINCETYEIREYPNYLASDKPDYTYGGINWAWFEMFGHDIPIGKRYANLVIRFGHVCRD